MEFQFPYKLIVLSFNLKFSLNYTKLLKVKFPKVPFFHHIFLEKL